MKKKILFLCTGNSCRSQMAEGLLRHLAKDKYEIYSAGINPTRVNPLAVKTIGEIGIDISNQKSKSVNEFLKKQFDCVVTVCDNARQNCPVFPGVSEKIHWNMEDPALAQGDDEEKLRAFRIARNLLKEKILDFLNLKKDQPR